MLHRYACVRQTDQSDCGAAALATVALHYRRPIRLQQLRDLAGTDRIGTTLLGLVHAAERLGFAAKGVKGAHDALYRPRHNRGGPGPLRGALSRAKARRCGGRSRPQYPDTGPRRVLSAVDRLPAVARARTARVPGRCGDAFFFAIAFLLCHVTLLP